VKIIDKIIDVISRGRIIDIIEVVVALCMLVSMFVILFRKPEQGIGPSIIKFAGVTIVLPIIFILSLEKIIPMEVAGTLWGTVVGYFFSRIEKNGK
jgi:hypothetical protein